MNSIAGDVIVKSKYFQSTPVKKLKRYRSAFTTEQINYLETEFKKFPYIGSANRKEIANILKMSERAIKIWFQNRRMKEKRETGNKEAIVDDKIKAKFPKDLLNVTHNEPSAKDKIFISNPFPTSQNNYLLDPKVKIRKAPVNIENMNLTIKQNSNRIAPKNLNNSSKIKPILPSKIRNIKKNLTQQSFIANTSYFNEFNHAGKYHSNARNEPIQQSSNPASGKMKATERAQDLSFRRNNKVQRQFYPGQTNTNPSYIPVHPQSYLAPSIAGTSAMHSGNVIWKPVNLMPVMPALATPVTTGHNNAGCSSNNHQNSKGSCNFHGPLHLLNTQIHCSSSHRPQYILAIPFSNPI